MQKISKCVQNYSKNHSKIFAGKNDKFLALPAINFCRQIAGKAHVYLQLSSFAFYRRLMETDYMGF